MKVMGSKPEAGSLLRSVLLRQLPDFKLKLCNSTLATLGPMLKGLGLLESL